jgi:hypothetical protein
MVRSVTWDPRSDDITNTAGGGDVYDELARAVETSLDMDRIWRMLKVG